MVSTRACLEPCLCMVLCRWRTPHVWLGSIRPRSQCVGGMLLVQWCYNHVLELSHIPPTLRCSRGYQNNQCWCERRWKCSERTMKGGEDAVKGR